MIFAQSTGKETREKLKKMKDHSKKYIVKNSSSRIEDTLNVIEQKFEKLSEMVEILHQKEGEKKKKA